MSRIKIIGGGLTGILAAFQAHAKGARKIELHERLDQLGGVALPAIQSGLEMREGCIYFGPEGDPMRSLLELHRVEFENFDNHFGSVSPGQEQLIRLEDFGGPVLPSSDLALSPSKGVSLADRLSCYPEEIAAPLLRYAEWHLGCDASIVHESAATPLAINRIYPSKADSGQLADLKKNDPLADELLAIPRSLWGRTSNLTASLPVGGFPEMLRKCRAALEGLGVDIHDRNLVRPKQVFADHEEGDVLIWAASPTPLFKAMDVPVPKFVTKSFVTHVFEAKWTGPLPFYVQNFTAQGSCFRLYLYESGQQTLCTAECVSKSDDAALNAEIAHLLVGFGGKLALGNRLSKTVKPRWIYHSMDTITRLSELRNALADKFGPRFVPGAWEPYAKGEKFAEMDVSLSLALASN